MNDFLKTPLEFQTANGRFSGFTVTETSFCSQKGMVKVICFLIDCTDPITHDRVYSRIMRKVCRSIIFKLHRLGRNNNNNK